jgi:tetratricopeptide (TPR) repeat protein
MDEALALAEIRRAVFDLRHSDPQEAVRVLRRVAAEGGDTEVLARGALGEIYLEEFADLDGAESEFRKVLMAVPGLPAAELGLARVLREQGDLRGADASFERALLGLARDLETFRKSSEPLPPGVEEVVLTLIEVAIELAELRSTRQPVEVPLDETLLQWAESERLFDASEDEDDWVRFHALKTQLRIFTGRAAEAVRELAAAPDLPDSERARLLSLAHEELGDAKAAGEQARLMLEETELPWRLADVVRAAALSGDRKLLERALEDALKRGAADEIATYREALALPSLVTLGKPN